MDYFEPEFRTYDQLTPSFDAFSGYLLTHLNV